MNVQQLFEAFGNIDDQYIEEAASDAVPHLKWKIAGVAAAAAAVIAGTILFSNAMLNRPTPTPQDLAAPIVTAAPVETAQPASEPSGSVPVAPEGEGDVTPEGESSVTTPAQPTPPQPESPGGSGNGGGLIGNSGSGGSGSGLPGFGGQGAGLPGSGGSGQLPGSSAGMPNPFDLVQYSGRYYHSDAGDVIVFVDSQFGVPVLTKNITGQIVDGHYAATVYGFPFGQSRYVELQVHDDGSYDLQVY